MYKKRKISFFIFIILFISLISGLLIHNLQSPKLLVKATPKPNTINPIHSSHLYDPAFFTQATDKNVIYKKYPGVQVFGGILPHHLLAAPMISGFFEGIADQKIETVILLSPNHYGLSPYNITSSRGVWTTIYGNLPTDTPKISLLEKNKTVFISEDLFDNEHGIYGITPFIKKTFPNSKLVPIAIKSGTTKQECDNLAKSLNEIFDDHTIIIVSADFSHYLPSEQADAHDKESIPAIVSFNTEKVFNLDHVKNIDSPESVYTLLRTMQLKNATTPILLANTNSAKLTGQHDLQSTTSYLTMYFTEQKNNLTADKIFQYVDPFQAAVKNNNPGEYAIIATGDVIPSRSVNAKLLQLNNFNFPFEKTANFLKSADAVFINLETSLIPDCRSTNEGMIFCGDQRNVQGLKYAGINVANIANNHFGNYGIDGINSTINLLKQNNIGVTGNGEPAIITIKDKKFGFLGYNNIGGKEKGIAWAEIPQIQKDINSLKNQADFIIVAFHWGVEYVSSPNSTQIELAHTAIDAGADLIIGNHPHWVQGIEQYKGKFITYAHGNFVFDQMWSQNTREGVLGKYTFNNQGLKDVKFIPVIIDDYSQPRFATQPEAEKILKRMRESSR